MKFIAWQRVSHCVWQTLIGVGLFAAGFTLAIHEIDDTTSITVAAHRHDAGLVALEESTRADLDMVVRNVGLSPMELPEISRALKRGEGIPLGELVRRRQDVLAAIPQLQPAEGWVSSLFGQRSVPGHLNSVFHRGIDIAGQKGTVVRAPADGVVRFAGRYGGFGNYVAIVHGYGIVTKYAHGQQLLVTSGQHVRRGDPIATMGESGRARGVHLHYEVWINDKPVDPLAFMPDLRLATGLTLATGPTSDWKMDP